MRSLCFLLLLAFAMAALPTNKTKAAAAKKTSDALRLLQPAIKSLQKLKLLQQKMPNKDNNTLAEGVVETTLAAGGGQMSTRRPKLTKAPAPRPNECRPGDSCGGNGGDDELFVTCGYKGKFTALHSQMHRGGPVNKYPKCQSGIKCKKDYDCRGLSGACSDAICWLELDRPMFFKCQRVCKN